MHPLQHPWSLRHQHDRGQTTLRLANEVDNIVAIKEASGNLEQVAAILAGAPEGFEVISQEMMPLPTTS